MKSREEAVRLAAELVERMGNTEDLNKRGYKIDGWKPMTGPERADAIVKIANVLIGPDEGSVCPRPSAHLPAEDEAKLVRPSDPPPPAPFPGRPPGSPT